MLADLGRKSSGDEPMLAAAATHDSFYTTGSFWVAVGGGLIAITFGILDQFERRRRRAMHFTTDEPGTRLLATPDDFPGTLEVRHNGEVLKDPHLLRIELLNAGPGDIS